MTVIENTSNLPAQPVDVVNDKTAQIYRTAAKVIVEKGFDATSMNDIADAAEMTKGGLYYYISGKKELLFSIMQFAMDSVDSLVLEPAQDIDDAEERLRFILQRHAGMTQYVREITILTEEIAALTEDHRQIIVARKRRYLDFVRRTLKDLKEEGRLRDLDVTLAALNLFSKVLGMARWFKPNGLLTAEQVTEETSMFILGGLLKDN